MPRTRLARESEAVRGKPEKKSTELNMFLRAQPCFFFHRIHRTQNCHDVGRTGSLLRWIETAIVYSQESTVVRHSLGAGRRSPPFCGAGGVGSICRPIFLRGTPKGLVPARVPRSRQFGKTRQFIRPEQLLCHRW